MPTIAGMAIIEASQYDGDILFAIPIALNSNIAIDSIVNVQGCETLSFPLQ
jgi:hypothetical protein